MPEVMLNLPIANYKKSCIMETRECSRHTRQGCAMKQLSDPAAIVDSNMSTYIRRSLATDSTNTLTLMMGHLLVGKRVMAHYEVDMSEPRAQAVANEFLRGVITRRTI